MLLWVVIRDGIAVGRYSTWYASSLEYSTGRSSMSDGYHHGQYILLCVVYYHVLTSLCRWGSTVFWCHSLTAQLSMPRSTSLWVRRTAYTYENSRRLIVNKGCSFTFHTILITHQHVYFNSSSGSMSSAHKESSSWTNSQTRKVIWFQSIAWYLLSAELPTLGTSSPTEKSASARGPNCVYIIYVYCIACIDDVVLTSWYLKVTVPLSLFVVVENSLTSSTLCSWRRVQYGNRSTDETNWSMDHCLPFKVDHEAFLDFLFGLTFHCSCWRVKLWQSEHYLEDTKHQRLTHLSEVDSSRNRKDKCGSVILLRAWFRSDGSGFPALSTHVLLRGKGETWETLAEETDFIDCLGEVLVLMTWLDGWGCGAA